MAIWIYVVTFSKTIIIFLENCYQNNFCFFFISLNLGMTKRPNSMTSMLLEDSLFFRLNYLYNNITSINKDILIQSKSCIL